MDWKVIDGELTRLAGRRAAQDYEEGRWLVAGRRASVHLQLGFSTFSEYVERKLGYDPRTTAERLRVATALEMLPSTREALRTGRRSWSSVRELTRVVVPDTESDWLKATENETVRQIEARVRGRRPGDGPSDPKPPKLQRRTLRHDLGPEAFALYQAASERLRTEVDPGLSEEAVMMEMCRRVLGNPVDEGRSPYQVQLMRCDSCGRTWQHAKGEAIEVEPEVGERASCDEQVIDGSAHVGATALRSRQSVTPALRRKLMRRDGGRCRVPGCRNTRWLEVHHVLLQSEGGAHVPSNLAVICGSHHAMNHRGQLIIEGDAEGELIFRHADGTPYGEPVRPERLEVHGDAFLGLRELGFGETQSHALLKEASAHVGTAASAEELLWAAVRIAHGMTMRVCETALMYGGQSLDLHRGRLAASSGTGDREPPTARSRWSYYENKKMCLRPAGSEGSTLQPG